MKTKIRMSTNSEIRQLVQKNEQLETKVRNLERKVQYLAEQTEAHSLLLEYVRRRSGDYKDE